MKKLLKIRRAYFDLTATNVQAAHDNQRQTMSRDTALPQMQLKKQILCLCDRKSDKELKDKI